jgi:hypothetical protein
LVKSQQLFGRILEVPSWAPRIVDLVVLSGPFHAVLKLPIVQSRRDHFFYLLFLFFVNHNRRWKISNLTGQRVRVSG